MIKRLKIKIVFSTMLLLSTVAMAAFFGVYLITKNNIQEKSIQAMINAFQKSPTGLFHPQESGDAENFNIITIELLENEKTFLIDGYSAAMVDLTESDIAYINTLISAVKNSGSNSGVIKSEGYNYRYIIDNNPVKSKIVLLDKTYEEHTLNSLLISEIMIGTVLFISFLFVTILVANISVAPTEKSWNQQKRLVSDASHELKTPLTIISANADLIMSKPDSTIKDQQKWLGYIKEETERMTELINNMLFLAKSEDEKQMPEMSTINLSDIATEATLAFESVCFENKKRFYTDIQPDIFIKGDASSIRRLITIFLDNACKYSNENGHVEYYLYAENDKAEMVIRNSGDPIPKDEIQNIFTRFYRVNKSRSRTEGGYGLGLSIAKTIIDVHGGKISVTSSKENGTVFKCSFKKLKKIN